MSQIISFSADRDFANILEDLIIDSGYQNRSRFLRDAALYFSDLKKRGELEEMSDDKLVEGNLIIYYQHGIESKILEIRHSNQLDISSYSHSCLKHSHSCVDIMQALGKASSFRTVIEQLQNTPNVDKVSFVSAPPREYGCC